MTPIRHGWSKPSTILFATEFPANEKAFAFAVAEAIECGSELIIFHAYDHGGASAPGTPGNRRHHYAAARIAKKQFEPLALRARELGIECRIAVRPGQAADEILNFLRGRRIGRLVIGARTPGPTGKLLVGSVAETLLRSANVPVNIVGPFVVEGAYHNFATHTILCSVGAHESSQVVVRFAAELAARHNAHLILQHVIPPQESARVLAGRTVGQIENELMGFIPARLVGKIRARTNVVLGDPTEELLYQGRVQQANLIVVGAHGASHFAAVTNGALVYKVLAYARCPVLTLSPVVLAESGTYGDVHEPSEVNFLAGVL
jgi:nucleotide-binding universal stress UspA family protein